MGHLSMNSSVDLQCHGNRRQVFWCVRPDLTRLIIRDRPTKTTCVGLFLGCGIERSLMKGSECGMGVGNISAAFGKEYNVTTFY